MNQKSRLVMFLLIISLVSMFFACGDDDKVLGSGDDDLISLVKNGRFTSHPAPEPTIGQAVAAFFGSPRWTSLTGTDGQSYVNVTGQITFQEVPVRALVQFRVNRVARTFEINAFEMNDIPQNDLMKLALIEAMYE